MSEYLNIHILDIKIYDIYIQNRLVEQVNTLNRIKITLRKIDKLLIRNIIIINQMYFSNHMEV